MFIKRSTFLFLFFLIPAFAGFAQILEPVTWDFRKERVSEDEVKLVFTANIDDTWYLYSTDVPPGGPVPTTFSFEESPHYELAGGINPETESYRKFDPTFEMDLDLYSEEAVFSQSVDILTEEPFFIEGYVEFMSCDDTRCMPPQQSEFRFSINAAEEAEAETAPPDTAEVPGRDRSLWMFFFISFLGGLAGLLTPCVFPLIPMTVSYFMQKQSNRLNSILSALVFGLSIIGIYTGIGLLVSLTTVGAGFTGSLITHWIPNTIFFILFIIFAASFFGMFELTIPGSLATKTDKKADRGGVAGSFFMALTLVIVSLSCVGPIVGAILVQAASGMGTEPVIGMLGFSIAFSLPFTLLAIFPSYLNKLPKSGGWLNSVKIVLGFIVLAFSLRFLSLIDQSYHLGILGREIFIAFWIVLFTLLGFYLLGKIRFANDSKLEHIGVPRLFLAIASFTFVVYLIPGMFGAPLKAVSSVLPPEHTHSFNIRSIVSEAAPSGSTVHATALCEDPKYADFLHLPHNLEGYFDLDQAIACAMELDKPLFVYFSGHACSNCKQMEARVWSDPSVLQRLREDYVIVTLYVDERNRLPEEEWYTSEFDNRVKRTIGQQNLDYQITKFNTNTQPFFVLMDHNQEKLVPPYGYSLSIEGFREFLDSGTDAYTGGN